ncbi:type IV secretory system conjugative DNA transfer family protein [Streptodolium elevatio]|uniref:TraM recognition domain-containing protein n=1 Tax=Streptodolium elevatio TaxID=3157996 RepID=A0ABV3DA83_9ACTN
MTSTIRRRGPDIGAHILIVFMIGLNIVALLVAYLIAARLGRPAWSAIVIVVVVAVDIAVSWDLRPRGRSHIDVAARLLESPSRMSRNTAEGVRRVARDLGYGHLSSPGLYLGKSVRGDRELWSTWEDMYVEISGPGTGKTMSRAIPNIITAPGPVIVTSCKNHVVEATRALRERQGRTWVYDPQNVWGERPDWYFSPLQLIEGEMKEAMTVAGLFMSTQRQEHHRTDAYFEPAAQSLISLMLFAADAGRRPITDILRWLKRPDDDTPVNLIRDVDRHHLAVHAFEGLVALPVSQRAGVYGAATQYMSWLGVPGIIPWITPGEGREEFPFVQFARESTDTLYVMSRTDDKTASPAVSAITAAVVVVGETGSAKMPGGRLRKPLLAVLDEPANVAQLQLWPNRYSHFGSRGVIVMTMLQSWAQGVDVWGADGMAKLWGAASVRVYGGGGTEARTIDDYALAAGKFEPGTVSTSHQIPRLKGSYSRGSREEAILHPSDVANLPRGRLLIQMSGQRPILAKSEPWTEGPYADEIKRSIAKYRR